MRLLPTSAGIVIGVLATIALVRYAGTLDWTSVAPSAFLLCSVSIAIVGAYGWLIGNRQKS